MQQRSRAVAWCAAALCVSVSFLACAVRAEAQSPDFTGVWTTYTEPGQAGGGGRRGAAAAAHRSGKEEDRRVSALGQPPAIRRAATASAPACPGRCWDRAAIRWRSINGPSRSSSSTRRTARFGAFTSATDRARSGRFRAATATPAAAGKATRSWSKRPISSSRWTSNTPTAIRRASSSAIISRRGKGEKVLVAEMTMTDPEFYTEPVKAGRSGRACQRPSAAVRMRRGNWLKRLEELEKQAAGKRNMRGA